MNLTYPLTTQDFTKIVLPALKNGREREIVLSNASEREAAALNRIISMITPGLLEHIETQVVALTELATGALGIDPEHVTQTEWASESLRDTLLEKNTSAGIEFRKALTSSQRYRPEQVDVWAPGLSWAIVALCGYYEWSTPLRDR